MVRANHTYAPGMSHSKQAENDVDFLLLLLVLGVMVALTIACGSQCGRTSEPRPSGMDVAEPHSLDVSR